MIMFKSIFPKFVPARRNLARSVSFELSPELREIRKESRTLASELLRPAAARLDREALFPGEQLRALAGRGFLALCPERGAGSLGLAVAVEELARGCAATAAIVSIHNCLYANLVAEHGSVAQRDAFLAPSSAAQLGCFALSEPGAGSDVAAISCTAEKHRSTWLLNGRKSWVTSAPQSKYAIVFASVDRTRKHRGITVDLARDGVTVCDREDLMGIRALSTCDVLLKDVVVPEDNMIGNEGEGFKIAMTRLDQARIGIAAQAIGIAQAALDYAMEHATTRIAFGKPLSQLSAVQQRLADMVVSIESARLLTWKAAVAYDKGQRSTKHSSLAKLAASQAANKAADHCVQILGGHGYSKRYQAERYYRDARVTEIYGGVTDVQKMVIAQGLLKEFLNNQQ